ncbi:MAG TPA: TIR domain-containing protein [Chitinophagaceae bacterium]|nr:TIR domain-containing protein [Chitinophagaceae bacterium]
MLKNLLQSELNSSIAYLKETELLSKANPGNIQLLHKLFLCYIRTGTLYQSNNDWDLATDAFNSSLTIIEQLIFTDPENIEWQLDACMVYEMLGNIFLEKKDLTKAEQYFLRAIEICKNILGEKHPACIARINNLKFFYKKSIPVNTLNQVYGNMKNAMEGNPPLTKIENMLLEAEKYQPGNFKINEKVNFAVSFPACMVPSETYVLDVWLFIEEQRNKLLLRVKEENDEKINIKSEGPVIIERGTTITTRLFIDKLVIEPQEKTLLWAGDVTNSSFLIKVPENINESTLTGRVDFYINGLEISLLYFKVKIIVNEKNDSKAVSGLAMADKHRTAFASYASEDRNDVLARVQGLEMAGIDVFLDVRNLRSGERYEEKLLEKILDADIFYLFWSSAAKKSEWVKKEWEYAFKNKGIDFINPIPLESPDIAPPPPELSRVLHFGDWTLAYKRSNTNN